MPALLAALGVLLISLDSSINIAFPAMATAFDVPATAVRWVIICYVLTYAVTAFAAGTLADRVGPAPVFTAGLWLSVGCFLAYLLAPAFDAVLALRVAQGIGAGLVYGTAPALVTLSLPPERHGRGLGGMTLGMGAGLSVGPALGGALVEAGGWAAAFVYRAPLAGLLALGASWRLRIARAGAGRWRMIPGPEVLGWPVLRALALAFLANYAQFAVWLLVPFYLVSVRGLSPTVGGFLFTLTPLGVAGAAPAAGWVTDRFGPRWPVVAGLALETAGLLATSRLAEESGLGHVALALAAVGLGLGLFQVPNMAQVMAAFPPARQGAAGGLAFAIRTFGVVAGVEMAARLFGSRLDAQGFAGAFGAAFVGAAAVCALGLALALLPGAPPGGKRA